MKTPIAMKIAAAAFGMVLAVQPVAAMPAFGSAHALATPAALASPYAYTRVLKKGCKGQDVKALQNRLKQLGYYKSTVDSAFGSGTEGSVKSFQRAAGLSADGVVGKTTYNAICKAKPAGSGTSTPTSTPKTTPTPKATATPSPSGGDTSGYGALDNQVTLRTGSKGNNVKDLQKALKQKGFFTGNITGSFESQTKSAVMSFQRSVRLDADGVAGNYTLSALYSLLNPPDLSTIQPWPANLNCGWGYHVEMLTWDNVKDSAFKRTMNAAVVDVRTGYAFQIRRTGGTNHADVEPLAALDTATFFKAAGNFSWARRPIWVIVNGRRLAASMNCMPHGYESLGGNDMVGQFCIHFVGSRTHGSNKVDPDHQKAIEEAYQAGLSKTPPPSTSATPRPSTTPTPTSAPSIPPQPPAPTPGPIDE